MISYQECPEAMRQQAKENKKDLYLEIAECLLAVPVEGKNTRELYEDALILKGVLEAMDPMIYELYRDISDKYVRIMRLIWEEGGVRQGVIGKPQWQELLEFGEAKHFLLRDWFIRWEKQHFPGKELSLEGMEELPIKLLLVTPRSVCFELTGTGKYETTDNYRVYLDGESVETQEHVVRSIYGLLPEEEYILTVIREDGRAGGRIAFTTAAESVTLNVRDFGAVGDGVSDDTHQIQTAIMNCPARGRVLIPAGTYLIKSLFFKSNMQLELAKGAELRALTEREGHGYQPGVLPSTDGNGEYHFGTWEGNPEPMFSGILCGVEAENVIIYGEGVLNGSASFENWWKDHRNMRMAYRPRLFFIRDCRGISLQGITLKNSPSWTIHPFFSDDLGFYDFSIENPFDSPNTDGLDPESCHNIEVAGVRFSLGDDCIAVKSGKIYMGRKYKRATENMRVHHCLMRDGHGAVTVGSEMAGGVRNLLVEDCSFRHTDRGLRVKTRRGRGKDAVLDRICFRNIEMDHVLTPFVVNAFYFCDPDGKTTYVQSRDLYPVDERTPVIRRLEFENIRADNCHVAAAYIEGLPEAKVEELVMRNIRVSYAQDPKSGVPAMSNGVEPCSRRGIFVRNVQHVVLDGVEIAGQEGKAVELVEVDEITER